MNKCKNCGHEIKEGFKNKNFHFDSKSEIRFLQTKCYCGCKNTEPEDKKEITQILSEIQEWKEVD